MPPKKKPSAPASARIPKGAAAKQPLNSLRGVSSWPEAAAWLKARGIEARLLWFPDENHWVLKPQNSVLWHDTVNGWLKQHIGQ